MLQFIRENGTLVTLVGTILVQVFMAGKLIQRIDTLMKDMLELKNRFQVHLVDYEDVARKVAYLEGISEKEE